MKNQIQIFTREENGAVTVDWVVLTAAVVALGVAAGIAMTTGTTDLSENIWAYLDGLEFFE